MTPITTSDMVKCHWVKKENMMDFNYCEEYLKEVHQTKHYYGSIKKNIF